MNHFSEIAHFFKYSVKKSTKSYEKGMLIISTDIDVGSPELGIINKGKNDANVNNRYSEYQIGAIEEIAVPLFVKTFDTFNIPITFAVRGQLADVNSIVLNTLLNSRIKHDIAAHGYSHKRFTHLTRKEADDELQKISVKMNKVGINPTSFIFPRNCVAHLDLLEKYHYKCFRGDGNFLRDSMSIEKEGSLYNVHPSIYVDSYTNFTVLTKILDISIDRKVPFHIWFHFWNFGKDKDSISRKIKNSFSPFLHYANKKKKNGLLTIETMNSAIELCRFDTFVTK